MSATPRSADGEATPDGLDEPAFGVTGVAYGHVTPADVGVTIGVGVAAPVPTVIYTGPSEPAAGTTIENVIINETIDIEQPNVTLRNVILNSDSDFPIQIKGSNVTDTLIEYSQINCKSSGKVFDNVDARRTIIRNNEVTGCQDFFFIEGPLVTMLIENNYMHSLIGDSGAHADGFQIGEFTTTTGQITIRGNYFEVNNNEIGKTDILFATGDSRNDILMENNFFPRWGWFTLRCGGTASACYIRNNVYDDVFQTLFADESSSPSAAYWHDIDNTATGLFECNRYEDGSFVERTHVKDSGSGLVTYDVTDCPSYPPSR